MNSEDLFEYIGELDEKLVKEAENFVFEKKKRNIIPYIVSVAAVLAIVISAGFIIRNFGGFNEFVVEVDETSSEAESPNGEFATDPANKNTTADNNNENETTSDTTTPDASQNDEPSEYTPVVVEPLKITSVIYPERVQYPLSYIDEDGFPDYSQEYFDAMSLYDKNIREIRTLKTELPGLSSFSVSILTEFLTGKTGENKVISPLNIFMALSMLAETTDGNSRQQILSLLGVSSVEELRQQTNIIWQRNYRNDGISKCLLANSIWLNSDVEYNKSALTDIADKYYAESYSGTMGTDDYNSMFNNWIKNNTDGMFDPDFDMSQQAIFYLVSTLVFNSRWSEEFSAEATVPGTFNSPSGNINVSYMQRSRSGNYFWGDNFSAVSIDLAIGANMWFILPDEGVSADSIFADSELHKLITEKSDYEKKKSVKINMGIPKFDVSGSTDILEGLGNLGVTDISNPYLADFSPLCSNTNGIAITKAQNNVRVIVDEEGVAAASYVLIENAGSSMPPDDYVDFILNRPFAFVVTLDHETILFAGVVNNP